MSYNTTTIAAVFTALYAPLRRSYQMYAANYGARQYLVFANVVLKRPDRIPYYTSVQGARDVNNPAGYLPTDLSAYYFRERPIYFYDQQSFMDWRIASKPVFNLSNNPPYILLNLFINGAYRDVVINYDSSKMTLEFLAVDGNLLVVEDERITALQDVLDEVINELSIAYNQVVLFEQARAAGKYKNDNFLYRSNYGAKVLVEKWIADLQKDWRFCVKVCRECGGNAQLGATSTPSYITIVGAVALTWLAKGWSEYNSVKYYLDELLIQIERLRVALDTEWKAYQGGKPPVEVDVPLEPPVEVTAKKNTNWLLYALIALGVVAVIDSPSSKKERA